MVITFNVTAQTNLVPNGDMEEWASFDDYPLEWYRFFNGWWEKSSDSQNGNFSTQLEIYEGQTLNFIFTPDITFTNGTTYVCTVYYKLVSGDFSEIELAVYHKPGVFPETLIEKSSSDFSTSEWKTIALECTSATTEEIQLYIYTYGNEGGKIIVDNVSIYDKSTLSTNNLAGKEQIKTFPNPTTDSVFIQGLKYSNKYSVYSILGQEVLNGRVSQSENTINVKTLKNGIYLLRLESGNVIKFIKKIRILPVPIFLNLKSNLLNYKFKKVVFCIEMPKYSV